MHLWIVNPFDPLPGEEEQLGRYGYLAQLLRSQGHRVTWWSSLFSHRFKRQVDPELVRAGAQEMGIEVRLVEAPAYQRNVSFARLRNHRLLADRFLGEAATQPHPDLVLASSPPLEMAWKAANLAAEWRVPCVIDIQDLWPHTFARALPRALFPLRKAIFAPYYGLERSACQAATGIVGVARGYVERGTEVGGAKRHTGVFPLGVNLDDVQSAMRRGRERYLSRWEKPSGQIWLLYSGSLSHSYDFMTCVRAAAAIGAKYGEQRVRFIVTGQGELSGAAHNLVRELGLNNVTLTGFLDFEEWACILSQADVGLNASFPDALIYLPNKIFYYLAAGAAVLNTIPGECQEMVESSGCGLSYTAGDVEGCVAAIDKVVSNPPLLAQMQAASARLASEVYDRRLVYASFARFLEQVAADPLG